LTAKACFCWECGSLGTASALSPYHLVRYWLHGKKSGGFPHSLASIMQTVWRTIDRSPAGILSSAAGNDTCRGWNSGGVVSFAPPAATGTGLIRVEDYNGAEPAPPSLQPGEAEESWCTKVAAMHRWRFMVRAVASDASKKALRCRSFSGQLREFFVRKGLHGRGPCISPRCNACHEFCQRISVGHFDRDNRVILAGRYIATEYSTAQFLSPTSPGLVPFADVFCVLRALVSPV